ncbi:pentatricopeptide repeat-containing protein At1g11290, chloroplastic-like [Pistacia vera]|uniref:pentatricopeptide repeat-containing protein At1g11290, chloroplastic-like n=1 Tax=Pistacia vera TaxID=55513 RepID=UPI001263A5FD|nr:pentatricopeptide repeat-containing protein At1g11290, chloroplastic-like [Pistacia vera]
MCCILRNAYKVFDRITQRHSFTGNDIRILCYVTLPQKYSYTNPIDLYAQEEDSVISCTSKISNLVRKNKPEEAVGLFKTNFMSDQRPNYVTVLNVAGAFGALNCLELIKMVHGLVIKMGFQSEVVVLTAILGFYCDHDMAVAWKLFEKISNKDVVLCSAMVAACVKNALYIEAVELFREMQCYGVKRNHVTVMSILPACVYISDGLSLGKQIHAFSIRQGFISFTNVQNSLVDMYAKCKDLGASIRVFDGNWKKNLISWRIMIRSCIENDCTRKALGFFSLMQFRCFEPDETMIGDILVALLQLEETTFGLSFHCYLLKKGFLNFSFLGTTLLHMYAKFGELGMARNLFDQLIHKDLIAWSAMISVYAQGGQPYNALTTFKQMQLKNEKPNEFTFVSLLLACSSVGAQELGESIHTQLIKAGYTSNSYLTSALINFYCKFGRMKQGKALFDDISSKDLICWSSMIKGYGMNGYGDEALETFSNMLDSGVMPNDVVFISVLSACSHCGLEYEGWSWFHSMKEKYDITPKLSHYACMVDLLSHQGKVEEALEFVKKMPVKPDKRIWGTLISGCRLARGSIEIAEYVVE